MKKPQCIKPTSYNCGQACINLSKSCKSSPSDSIGRSRLQKLKQVALLYSKSNTKKAERLKGGADRLINTITKARQETATELKESRSEINKERKKARLKAEAKAKREQLVSMYDELQDTSVTEKQTLKKLSSANPEQLIKKQTEKYRGEVNKLLKTDLQEAERVTKTALKVLGGVNSQTQAFLAKARKLVEVDSPTPVNAQVESKTPEAHQKGVEAFSRMIAIPDLKDPIAIVDTPPERNGRSCYRSKTNKVFMGNEDPAVLVHEMSHWLEEKVPGIRQEVADFYNKRTEGEKAVKLKDATKNSNYGDNEITKVDKWLNPYMGKEYKNASEILSMGMEMMYSNPAYLAKNDPEMFDFIYSVVRRK